MVIKILFLAANPLDTDRLQLDEEVRAIDAALRRAKYRDRFELVTQWAVRIGDLQEHLLYHEPHIVHFSGHGSPGGEIVLNDPAGGRTVPVEPLSNLFGILKDNIRCVVLHACYSESQAQAIAQHIESVVGMASAVDDQTACQFSAAFYQALAYGRSVQTAFDLAQNQLDLASLSHAYAPQLLATLCDPTQLVLIPTNPTTTDGATPSPATPPSITRIKTNGGAVVQGNVSAGGDFTGRDKHVGGDDVHGDKIVYIGSASPGKNKPKPSPQELRQIELAYLNKLVQDYQFWAEKYTPLAGIAEVKAATQDGPRLDLPMMFIPTGFEKLEAHGFGERREVERKPVDDLRQAVQDYRRLVVLGEPGSGKTTTLWRLAYDTAVAAQADETQPLPLLVPLGGYTGPEDALTFAQSHAGELAPYLPDLLEEKRIILLLDALNEMPQNGYRERVQRVQTLLDDFNDTPAVVTCRELDYVETLNLEKLEIKPLDVDRQRAYLHRYLGEEDGEKLFWAMAGGEEIFELWRRWANDNGVWDEFWQGQAESEPHYWRYTNVAAQQGFIERRRSGKLPPMIELGENPFMLVMLAQVYASEGELPQNRGRTFAAFVDTLLTREENRHDAESWPGEEPLRQGLARLAFAMQVEGERGTAVDAEWALTYLQTAECSGERARYLAASATLLDWRGDQLRFVHQLLQEYFAAVAWQKTIANEADLTKYWPDGWTEPSGWEETTILLAGIVDQMDDLVLTLLPIHPVLAARCIGESGGTQPLPETVTIVQQQLLEIATSTIHPIAERNAAANALVHVDDPRAGVGLNDQELPDVVWCHVPKGSFTMGDGGDEHTVDLEAFAISRYPVTNAQYTAFLEDGGYTDKWRACWTESGWQWRTGQNRTGPSTYGGAFDLPNHPVVGVSWYEAAAFCKWLSAKIGQTVQLPSEAQWEKAARGTDSRRYPWNGEISSDHCNYTETGLNTTTAVGIFPKGQSPYGLDGMSGNVWEWTSSRYMSYSYSTCEERENPEGIETRTLRGGAFNFNSKNAYCAYRLGYSPLYGDEVSGFRVVLLESPGFSDL